MSTIRAITFDLDGVYFINGKENFVKNLARLGVPESEIVRVYLESEEMNDQYKKGKMSDDEFWSWALHQWSLDRSVADVIQLLIEGYDVNEPVVGFLRRIRAKGFQTLVCSNNFPARINGLQARFGFLGDFDSVTLSYQVGATKPSRAIFKDLIERSGVDPEAIVFADDNDGKLSGAKELGIHTFVYTGFDEFTTSLRLLGVAA